MIDFTKQLIEMMAQSADKRLWESGKEPTEEHKAIQCMLKNSLFFSEKTVEDRHEIMKSEKDSLPCRYSQTMKGQIEIVEKKEGNKIKMIETHNGHPIDNDGNAAVRKVIKDHAKVTVSQGETSSIKFAKISHVWGEASNPNYFTSLWNIVLIPAYCNDLMDKKSGNFAIEVQDVYKAVCDKLYDAKGKLKELGGELPMGRIDKAQVSLEGDIVTVDFGSDSIAAKLTFLPINKENDQEDISKATVDLETYNEDYLSSQALLFGDLSEGSQASYKSYLNKAKEHFLAEKDKDPDRFGKFISALNKVLDYLENKKKSFTQ